VRVLHAFHRENYASKDDFEALLRFLAWPKCRLRELRLGPEGRDELGLQLVGGVQLPGDTKCLSPGAALITVLQHRNKSLVRRIRVEGTTPSVEEDIGFWCTMNGVCPHRMELRDPGTTLDLAVELARVSKIPNFNKSIIFDVLQTTQHLWSR